MAIEKHKSIGDTFVPINYKLKIEPNLKTFTFKGSETITGEQKKPTRTIRLNSKNLKISSAVVISHGKRQSCKIRQATDLEQILLSFTDKIHGKVLVNLEYEGVHDDSMAGFYRSRYTHNGKEGYIVTTQFEPTNARRAFPCIDEPEFKATFDVTLVIDSEMSGLSNMQIKRSAGSGAKKKAVTFYTTPKMSTYLLYLGAGRYTFTSGKLGKLPIRIITVPGKGAYTKLALEYAKKSIKFYEDYFGIPYQLPKLDLIAIPDFAAGAMENWGAITFREIALLNDKKTATVRSMQAIAITVAHEIAHQWFGDLVTMRWWDDLWLNESFATFMEAKALESLYPEWEIEKQEILDTLGVAYTFDQLSNTHPINVSVNDPAEIDNIFDEISYQKGGAVLKMLEDYVGKAAFRKGLQDYLKAHSYSNATKYDLWDSIARAAKRSGKEINLSKVASYWIDNPGYPVIRVERKDANRIGLSQERYFLLNKRDSQIWPIPLHYSISGKKQGFMLFDKKNAEIKVDESESIKLNLGQKGLYRSQYDSEMRERLGASIRSGKISAIDAWGIENDVFALARSTRVPIKDYVDFVVRYCFECDYPANAMISGHLSGFVKLLYGNIRMPELESANIRYHKVLLKRLGWVKRPNERSVDTMLRSSAIVQLGYAEDAEVISKAKRLFDDFIKKGKAIDPDIKAPVFVVNALNGDSKLFDLFLEMYKKEEMALEKLKCLHGISSFKDPKLIRRALDLSLSKDIRLQDASSIPMLIASKVYGKRIVWEWTKANWKTLIKRYEASSFRTLSDYVDNATALDTVKEKQDVVRFFSLKSNMREGIEQPLKQALEFIESNIRLIQANK